jgi:hypothetical protein
MTTKIAMIEFIIFIIFIISLGGVLFILARKIPVLTSLPQNGTTGIRKHRIILNTENKIKDFLVFFEKQIFLHKFLSWVKVMTLRIETRIDHSLHKIRKKAQQKGKK